MHANVDSISVYNQFSLIKTLILFKERGLLLTMPLH